MKQSVWRSRRAGLAGVAIGGAAALVIALVAPGPGRATLTNSSFNAGDGNLTLDSGELKDWQNVTLSANVADSSKGNILYGDPGDDAFANGAKEDDNPGSVGFGGVPPNKDDFTRMYIAQEHKSTGTAEIDFLYMGWVRTGNVGTAFEAFEFNQSSVISSNGVTPVRTAGDVLVLYDLENGGTVPTISIARWIAVDPGGASPCDNDKHRPPCWGLRQTLSGSSEEASINSGTITDPISGGSLAARTFGEAAINLQAAGIFGTGCTHLGKAFLTSRSSSSLDSTMKDYVRPANVNITNCGSVSIHKQDDTAAANPLANVVFTLWTDNAPLGGSRGAEDTVTTFTCTTNASGDCSIANVPLGQYWVVEGTPPAGYTAAPDQHIVLAGGSSTATLTFTNNRRPASVKVHKQDDDSPANPLGGVVFTLYKDNAPLGGSRGAEDTITSFTCTTNGSGDCTITNVLPAGPYWVVETTGKTGHATAADRLISLTLGQDLDISGTPFVDPRQFKVIVVVCAQADNSLYSSPVTIDGSSAGSSLDSAGASGAGLSESALCSLTAGAAGGKQYGSHTAGVNIPQ